MNKTNHCNPKVKGLTLGLIVEVTVVLMFTAFMARMRLTQQIGEGSEELYIYSALLIASLIGTIVYNHAATTYQIINGIIMLIATAAVLILISIMLDGQYNNVTSKILSLTAGTAISYIICLKIRKKKTHKKTKHR